MLGQIPKRNEGIKEDTVLRKKGKKGYIFSSCSLCSEPPLQYESSTMPGLEGPETLPSKQDSIPHSSPPGDSQPRPDS